MTWTTVFAKVDLQSLYKDALPNHVGYLSNSANVKKLLLHTEKYWTKVKGLTLPLSLLESIHVERGLVIFTVLASYVILLLSYQTQHHSTFCAIWSCLVGLQEFTVSLF